MTDVYFKKRLDYYCRGQSFAFDVAHTLFSSHQIDEGTDLFLRTIDVPAPRSIIDMGCGCGVIGIVLARRFPAAQVVSIDRDLLAVRYARHNALLNEAPNVTVLGSVGFEQVPATPFDLIVANPTRGSLTSYWITSPRMRWISSAICWVRFVIVSSQ